MGNSSTKLAEKCSLLSKDEVPVVASSFKFVSKNSERIKEDDLMVSNALVFNVNDSTNRGFLFYVFSANIHFFQNSILSRNSGAHKWIRDLLNT